MDTLVKRHSGRGRSMSRIEEIIRQIAAMAAQLGEWRRRRRTLHTLYGLSDRTLRDIGVSRGDVHIALYGPSDRAVAGAGRGDVRPAR